MGRGVLHTPHNPTRQEQESPRVAFSDSCRLRVRGYIFKSHSFRGRESPRGNLSSCRMGRGVLHTPHNPTRQERESPRVALSDSYRLRVCGNIFESHSFRGRESQRVALSDSCRLRVCGYIFESQPFWGRESPRADPSSFRMRRGVLHTPPNPPRQGQESPRVALSDSCRLRVCGYIFESHSFWGRESRRRLTSSCRMRRGVLHTPPRPPRQGRESPRVALSDSCRLKVRGYIFASHPFRGRERGAGRPSINQRAYRGVTTHEGRTDGPAHCTPIRDRYTQGVDAWVRPCLINAICSTVGRCFRHSPTSRRDRRSARVFS